MKNKIVLITLLVSGLYSFPTFGQDKLLNILKSELKQQMSELQAKDLPPYHMSYRVVEKHTSQIMSSMGAIVLSNKSKSRILVPQIRIGNREFDNFKNNDMGSMPSPAGYPVAYIPVDDNQGEDAIRQAIWREVNDRYNFAVGYYRTEKTRTLTKVDNEDKAPLFSDATVEKYYEAPYAKEKLEVSTELWTKRLNEISAIFKKYPKIVTGTSSLNYYVERRYFINSEGAEVVQNLPYARMMVSAQTIADDGMVLPLNLSYFAFSPEQLPNNDMIIKDAEKLAKKIIELRDAPIVDPYTGPALLSGAASGVFFHEIFGHRIEGQRMKKETDGQTFKSMVGDAVLPTMIQIYDDPTLTLYNGEPLNGHYKYDDQGVKSERVNVIVDGKINDFLMTRTPIDNHPRSNGHARADGGADPISRQSNLVIETKDAKTDEELRKLLIVELKKQGKEHGFFFKEVTGGLTYTGKGGINSFNVVPLEVYQIYADGRADRLVRGVDIIGTPLSMFTNIMCAGGEYQVFTGMCGAESGAIPVTAISPTILVNKLEVQRKPKSQEFPPILSRPLK